VPFSEPGLKEGEHVFLHLIMKNCVVESRSRPMNVRDGDDRVGIVKVWMDYQLRITETGHLSASEVEIEKFYVVRFVASYP